MSEEIKHKHTLEFGPWERAKSRMRTAAAIGFFFVIAMLVLAALIIAAIVKGIIIAVTFIATLIAEIVVFITWPFWYPIKSFVAIGDELARTVGKIPTGAFEIVTGIFAFALAASLCNDFWPGLKKNRVIWLLLHLLFGGWIMYLGNLILPQVLLINVARMYNSQDLIFFVLLEIYALVGSAIVTWSASDRFLGELGDGLENLLMIVIFAFGFISANIALTKLVQYYIVWVMIIVCFVVAEAGSKPFAKSASDLVKGLSWGLCITWLVMYPVLASRRFMYAMAQSIGEKSVEAMEIVLAFGLLLILLLFFKKRLDPEKNTIHASVVSMVILFVLYGWIFFAVNFVLKAWLVPFAIWLMP